MMDANFTAGELFVFNVIKHFYFLIKKYDYQITTLSISQFKEYWITFYSKKRRREIDVSWNDSGNLEIVFHNHQLYQNLFGEQDSTVFLQRMLKMKSPEISLPFKLTEENCSEVIETSAKYIHEHLLSIVEGKSWI